jgi:sugar O-acyltransferase (sialic acid O-acetyltransferase NeuD family)
MMNFIFGGAGFAKEVDWLIERIKDSGGSDYSADYFVVSDSDSSIGLLLNHRLVISESQYLAEYNDKQIHHCFIAVGSPIVRRKIVEKISNPCTVFPNLIDPTVQMDTRPGKIELGIGNVLCAGNILTTDISIGNFVHLNLNCTVGHDARLGDFCTVSPSVSLSGWADVQAGAFIGTGAVLIERMSVAAGSVIGAGAVVSKPITESGTYVGIPAKRIK